MSIHVNGRFLVQPISGVQRFARELLTALDARLAADPDLARRWGDVSVWYPEGAPLVAPPSWQVLKIRPLSGPGGHAWEQLSLGRKVGQDPLISLCGAGPIRCRNQVLVIHDANIWTLPKAFSRPYRLFHKTARFILARRVRQLATVSHYSAGELGRCLQVPADRFAVIGNSAEHILTTAGDDAVLARWGLTSGRYFLAAGNQSPNKNISRLIDALARVETADMPLAVAGGFTPGVAQAEMTASEQITLLGRVSDGELKTLYAHAAAFVWPSLYEGFGIPPLEAMSLGTPVLSSDTTAMPEILGDAALYFTPTDPSDITRALKAFLAMNPESRAALGARGRARAAEFSWAVSAERLIGLVNV
ncbi:glycosyltransferase family 1 protein [uncultured Pelagimonas sp.]|uniref:glycosyltransferase family 4 protein n=1 Tax=uncultured Pelagimonas sp. TaxID=1618102 RepID=UPI00263181A8|nr:glycosyltransferase family 1 protein [uncultured Pelagimonas sp.]